ncbi:TRAP transporter small permease [Allohahella sp. A8]|uniref:TRAP transporter small permease n=1 Tax=Allohahella sp. A8 TaxID=3141461 RepID=UPI003A7FE233
MTWLYTLWSRLEEAIVAFLLGAMTIVTCVYVILNNLYPVFYHFGDRFEASAPAVSEWFFNAGDLLIIPAQEMTWSNALVKVMFGWLIFIGIAYGVRTAGHIGIDALVKLASTPVQRRIGLIACLACLGYAGLMMVSSFQWMHAMYTYPVMAEDLGRFGIKQWHIALVVPIGFALVLVRLLEVFYRIWTHQQTGLGLADEARTAMKLAEEGLTETQQADAEVVKRAPRS